MQDKTADERWSILELQEYFLTVSIENHSAFCIIEILPQPMIAHIFGLQHVTYNIGIKVMYHQISM